MGDFVFDSLADGQRINFDAATDRLVVQDPLVQARFVSMRWWQEVGAGGFDTSVRMADGPLQGKTVVLLSTDIAQLSADNFSFAGGGLILVGDNSHFSISDNLNNQLSGSPSGDYFAGLGGNDRMSGLAGDDTFDFLVGTTSGYGHDTVAGGDGFDLISFDMSGDALVPVWVNLAIGFASGSYGLSDVTFTSVEAVIGTHFGDSLTGDDAANMLDGAGGGDTVVGGDGNDTLAGGAGDDRLDGGSGVDSVVYDGDPAGINANLLTGVVSDGFGGLDTLQSIENLVGSEFGDFIVGSGDSNTLDGGDGNDTLNGGAGNDTLDGGTGVDTAVFSGNRAAYTTAKTASGYTVSGPDDADTLSNIERLQFSDKKLAFDLDLNTVGGNTVRIIGAAFDANNLIPEYVGIGLDLFDSGMSMIDVCTLALGTSLYLSLAGSSSNEAFVNTVYQNLVGVLPSAGERDFYVGLLVGSGGTMTQADLLVLAANSEVNAQNIDLVGLQQNGVEFV